MSEISVEELIKLKEEKVLSYVLASDNKILAQSIYERLFDFYSYSPDEYSGDVIFTWKSPSLVEDGDYIGRRDFVVENKIVIGNIFPNFKTNHKYSLNLNRNGARGDFPHDYFDIYLDHVAKYAYGEDIARIKEYYPLKRAIQYEKNGLYFKQFNDFDNFLERNFFKEIWDKSQEKPFSDMNYEEFMQTTITLMNNRGKIMLNKLKECVDSK